MRIWDLMDPTDLCSQHLLAQWREGLGLWSIVIYGKTGYKNHPETRRWIDRPGPLHDILKSTRNAMLLRGWNPKPLPMAAPNTWRTLGMIFDSPTPWDDQLAVLRAKGCNCRIPKAVTA